MTKILSMLSVVVCTYCTPAPVPSSMPQPAPVSFVPSAPPPPVRPTPIVHVTQLYRKVARKEIRAVMSPKATPASVHQVHLADVEARIAIEQASREGDRSGELAARANNAVRDLMIIVDAAP